MPEKNLQYLYDTFSKTYDLGEYDAFAKKMQSEKNRKFFYDTFSKTHDLGDYKTFEGKIQIKPGLGEVVKESLTPKTTAKYMNPALTAGELALRALSTGYHAFAGLLPTRSGEFAGEKESLAQAIQRGKSTGEVLSEKEQIGLGRAFRTATGQYQAATPEQEKELGKFAADIIIDPLNLVGWGLGGKFIRFVKAGKVAEATSTINDIRAATSKVNIDEFVASLGKTKEESVLKQILTDIKEGVDPNEIIQRTAKENIDVSKLPDVTTGKAAEFTERAIAIEEGLKARDELAQAAEQLRQSPQGAEKLRESLRIRERIDRLTQQIEANKQAALPVEKPVADEARRQRAIETGKRVFAEQAAKRKQADDIIADLEKIRNDVESQILGETPRVTRRVRYEIGQEQAAREAEGLTPLEQLTAKVKAGKATGQEIKQAAKAAPEETEAALRKEFEAATTIEEKGAIAQGIDIVTQEAGKKPKVPKGAPTGAQKVRTAIFRDPDLRLKNSEIEGIYGAGTEESKKLIKQIGGGKKTLDDVSLQLQEAGTIPPAPEGYNSQHLINLISEDAPTVAKAEQELAKKADEVYGKTAKKYKPKERPTPPKPTREAEKLMYDDLNVGDEFTIDGEKFTVTYKMVDDETGRAFGIKLKDRKNYEQDWGDFETGIEFDAGSLKKAGEAPAPKAEPTPLEQVVKPLKEGESIPLQRGAQEFAEQQAKEGRPLEKLTRQQKKEKFAKKLEEGKYKGDMFVEEGKARQTSLLETPKEQLTPPKQTFREFVESKGVKWEQISGAEKDEALRQRLFDEFHGNKPSETPLEQLAKGGKRPTEPSPEAMGIIPRPPQILTKETRTRIRESFQNSQRRVEQLQEIPGVQLRGQGLDPYEAEIRFHGRKQKRLEDAQETVTQIDKNIVSTAKAANISDVELNDQVSRYLIAKHAPSYNAQHGAKAAGITDAEAATILNDIDNLPYANQVKRIGGDIQALNRQALDILHDGQVISDELYNKLTTLYPDYVPFRRILNDIPDSDLADVITGGKGFSVKSSGLKRAKGSELEIEDILAHSMGNLQEAIIRAENNRVGLSTLDFSRNNPQLGLFKEVKPKAIGLTFKKDPVTGKPVPMTNAAELMRDKNILTIRENGKNVYLEIKDTALANALKGTNLKDVGTPMRMINAITRFVTQTATRFNPAFQVPNILRDSQELAAYLMAHKDFGLGGALATEKRIPGSMKDIFDATFRKVDTPGTRLYNQLKLDGGTTGGFALSTRQQIKLNIDKIRKMNRSNPRKMAHEVAKFFDNYNTIFEDATRLSVYKEALNRGLPKEQAAVLAKEATINFNRKGTRGAHMNALYAFANASAQGSVKMLRAMKNPKVLATVTSSVAGAVLMQNMVNDAIDPEWRDKVPAWERNNNLVIVAPWQDKDGDYVRFLIPVSWGIKPIKTMADYAVDLAQGHDRGEAKDIAAGIAAAALDAYNPLGGSNLRQAVTPTFLDVPGDVWYNQAWYGKPIKPDSPFYPNLPEHKKYFRSLKETAPGRFAINTTDYLAEKGGIRISPNVLKYIIEQGGGGTARFAVQTFNTALNVAKPEATEVNEIPVVNRFLRVTPQDVIERWKESKRLDDPALKKNQEQSDLQRWERTTLVRDAFDQFKAAKTQAERSQVLRDLVNHDPKAFKPLMQRIKDDVRGISYYDSALKDLEPNYRAEMVAIELKRAKDRQARYRELVRAGVIDAQTARYLNQPKKGQTPLQQLIGVQP